MAKSPQDSNSRDGTADFHISSGLKQAQNQLQEAGTGTGTEPATGGWYCQIGAVLMAPLGSNRTRTELEQEWDQPGGLEPNRNRTGRGAGPQELNMNRTSRLGWNWSSN